MREAWGEEVATDLARYIEQVVQEQEVPRDERPDREGGSTLGVYREVLSHLDVLENEIEGRFGEVNERLDRTDERLDQMNIHIGERFDAMNAQMDERFDQMSNQPDRMNDRILSMTQWRIGPLVVFGTLVTALPAVAQVTA